MKSKSSQEPLWSSYFAQKMMHNYDWFIELFREADMSWVVEAQTELDDYRLLLSGRGGMVSGPAKFSTDPTSQDFPGYPYWPSHIKQSFDAEVKRERQRIADVVYTRGQVCHSYGLIRLFPKCSDGLSYVSTPYIDNGAVYEIELNSNSDSGHQFKSIQQAVNAFQRDWLRWNIKYGEKARRDKEASFLEKMGADHAVDAHMEFIMDALDDERERCIHADLGSLGYVHGRVVDCPRCGERCEVW